jgi:hypothetical protein
MKLNFHMLTIKKKREKENANTFLFSHASYARVKKLISDIQYKKKNIRTQITWLKVDDFFDVQISNLLCPLLHLLISRTFKKKTYHCDLLKS